MSNITTKRRRNAGGEETMPGPDERGSPGASRQGEAAPASLGVVAVLQTGCIRPYEWSYSKQRIKVITVLREGKGIQFQSQIKQSSQLEQMMFPVSRTAFLPAWPEFNFPNRLYFVTSLTSRWAIS